MVALGVSKTSETTAKEVHYDTLKSRTPVPRGTENNLSPDGSFLSLAKCHVTTDRKL